MKSSKNNITGLNVLNSMPNYTFDSVKYLEKGLLHPDNVSLSCLYISLGMRYSILPTLLEEYSKQDK